MPTLAADVTPEALGQELGQRHQNLETAVDPDRRQAALVEVLAPFQPGQPYAYVPAKEGSEPATAKFLAQEERRAGIHLYHLDRWIRHHEADVATMKAQAMRPPEAEEVYLERTREVGVSAELGQLLQIADELRHIRLTPALSSRPAAVLAAYDEAREDHTDQHNAAIIRITETLHGSGWSGPTVTDEELPIVLQLRHKIAETREARVPESIRNLEARLEAARRYADKVRTLHKISPVNPDHPFMER